KAPGGAANAGAPAQSATRISRRLFTTPPLGGHYARLRQAQQASEFLMTGSAVDPVIDCQFGGRCSTSAFGRSATVESGGRSRDYTSVCSAISGASSTSIPRYLTVLWSLVWPRRS